MQKLRPSKKKMILYGIITYIVGAVIIYLAFFNKFMTLPWDAIPIVIIVLYTAIVALFFILALKFYYYVIEKDFFVVRKMNKEIYYDYKDIVYIVEDRKSKNSAITFYLNNGAVRFLTPDKNDVLYETLLRKCHNLLSKEEMMARFPNIKL